MSVGPENYNWVGLPPINPDYIPYTSGSGTGVSSGPPAQTSYDAALAANNRLKSGLSLGLGPLLAALGTNPILLPLLLSFGPAVISKIFGGDPQKKLREGIAAIQNPEYIGRTTNEYYQNAIQGPGYSQGLASIAGGANQAANTLAQNLAARGLGTSGTGAILSSLTPSLVGNQQAALRAQAYQGAQAQAMEQVKARIAALTGTQGPSQTQQYLAGGLQSISPYIQQYMKTKFPDVYGPRTNEKTDEKTAFGFTHGAEGVRGGIA